MKFYRTGLSSLRFLSLMLLVALITPSQSFAIDAPPNTRGTEIAGSTVLWEWDWVPGVTRYEVTVDGAVVGTTPDPRYTSYNLWAGEHSLSVKAIDGNSQYSERSVTAKVIVGNNQGGTPSAASVSPPIIQNDQPSNAGMTAPQNPRAVEVGQSTVKWEWDWVPGASQYEVTIDGGAASLTSEQQFFSRNLWTGDHSMTVKAVSADSRYSPSSKTAKIITSGNYNAGNPAVSFIPGESNPPVNQPVAVVIAPPPPAPIQNPNPQPSNDQGQIDPASWSMPGVGKPGYELSFSDEFNGSTLNQSRWNTQLRWDGEFNGERYEYRVVNGESQFYVNTLAEHQEHRDTVAARYNPFEFNGSRLAIRAIKNPLKTSNANRTNGSLQEMVSQQHFLSGAISSYDKFTQKYGYFEARIKLPSHVGTFPAFWLHHQKRRWEGTRRTEIDIMENLGHAPWYVYNTFHYHNNVTAAYGGDPVFVKPQPEGQIYTGTDYSDGYHTYAVEWEPGHVAWMIDGQVVSQVWNDNVNYEELYIILNMAMGGNWTNFPTSSGGLGRPDNERFPASYDLENFNNPALEIDWVRAYKRR